MQLKNIVGIYDIVNELVVKQQRYGATRREYGILSRIKSHCER
jgi:hypothetical protein